MESAQRESICRACLGNGVGRLIPSMANMSLGVTKMQLTKNAQSQRDRSNEMLYRLRGPRGAAIGSISLPPTGCLVQSTGGNRSSPSNSLALAARIRAAAAFDVGTPSCQPPKVVDGADWNVMSRIGGTWWGGHSFRDTTTS